MLRPIQPYLRMYGGVGNNSQIVRRTADRNGVDYSSKSSSNSGSYEFHP